MDLCLGCTCDRLRGGDFTGLWGGTDSVRTEVIREGSGVDPERLGRCVRGNDVVHYWVRQVGIPSRLPDTSRNCLILLIRLIH